MIELSSIQCQCGRRKYRFKSHHSQVGDLYLCPDCNDSVNIDPTGKVRLEL